MTLLTYLLIYLSCTDTTLRYVAVMLKTVRYTTGEIRIYFPFATTSAILLLQLICTAWYYCKVFTKMLNQLDVFYFVLGYKSKNIVGLVYLVHGLQQLVDAVRNWNSICIEIGLR